MDKGRELGLPEELVELLMPLEVSSVMSAGTGYLATEYAYKLVLDTGYVPTYLSKDSTYQELVEKYNQLQGEKCGWLYYMGYKGKKDYFFLTCMLKISQIVSVDADRVNLKDKYLLTSDRRKWKLVKITKDRGIIDVDEYIVVYGQNTQQPEAIDFKIGYGMRYEKDIVKIEMGKHLYNTKIETVMPETVEIEEDKRLKYKKDIIRIEMGKHLYEPEFETIR